MFLTIAMVEGLAFCGVESLGSCGLGKLGRLMPWEMNKTVAIMMSGNKYFLFVNKVPKRFID